MDIQSITPYMSEIANLPQARHLSYSQRVDDRCQQYLIQQLGDDCPPRLRQAVQDYQQCVSDEDKAYKKSAASDRTADIAAGDDQRDNILSGLRQYCEAMLRIGTAEQQQAAQLVLKQIDLYKVYASDSYEDEGLKINQLCADLKRVANLKQAVKALNLTDKVEELDTVNEQVRQLVNLRNQARALTNTKAIVEARQRTDDAYRWLVRVLEAYAVIETEEQGGQSYSRFDLCIQVMNEDIHYYKTVVNRHSDTVTPKPDPAPDPEQNAGTTTTGDQKADDTTETTSQQ